MVLRRDLNLFRSLRLPIKYRVSQRTSHPGADFFVTHIYFKRRSMNSKRQRVIPIAHTELVFWSITLIYEGTKINTFVRVTL